MPILRLWGGTAETARPSKRISPESGARKPAIRLSVVVFPEPLGPSRVTKLPEGMSSDTSSTALTGPKSFVSRSSRTWAPARGARRLSSDDWRLPSLAATTLTTPLPSFRRPIGARSRALARDPRCGELGEPEVAILSDLFYHICQANTWRRSRSPSVRDMRPPAVLSMPQSPPASRFGSQTRKAARRSEKPRLGSAMEIAEQPKFPIFLTGCAQHWSILEGRSSDLENLTNRAGVAYLREIRSGGASLPSCRVLGAKREKCGHRFAPR